MLYPARFLKDIVGDNTNLIPLIVFENLDINISTARINIGVGKTFHDQSYPVDVWFDPILLNMPTISQKLDIGTRKFKISSVKLEISNLEYNGEIFSEKLSERSLLNEMVSIHLKSQGTNRVDTYEHIRNSAYSLVQHYEEHEESCPIIYEGYIKDISHGIEKLTNV